MLSWRENVKQIAIFVDGSNLAASARAAGFRIDFVKVLKYWQDQGKVIDASYFTALPSKEVPSPLRKLVDFLQYNGWVLVTKEVKDHLSSDGIFRVKGNMDVEIAVKAILLSDRITDLVLFSGDGDFTCLVEELQRKGIVVTVVSHFSRGDDCQISDDLRRQSNSFMDLKRHRDAFELKRRDK